MQPSIWLLLVGVAVFLQGRTDAALAAMSIDLGTQFIKVGLVKPGVPMEIVLNKESRRKTPNVISIRNGERLFGDAAQAVNVRYPSTVYGNLLDLVAKTIDHPSIQLFKQRFPHLAVAERANDSTAVVPFGDDSYSIEILLAMILSDVREFTEAYAEQPVKDVVITVPVYFTQLERLAVEKAAAIARLNLLQLINDGTAVGLNYGVFRRKEILEKSQRMLIYDMGSAKTTVTIAEYKMAKGKYAREPKMKILGVGFDRTLGGMELTLRLQQHIIEKFRANYKTEKDITTNERAMAKLFKEAERVKQVLSANADHFAQIESVHEDKDMRIKVTRDELNGLLAELESRMTAPIQQALAMAEIRMSEIDQVVLMGAGTRVPRVQEVLKTAVDGKELGRFMNTDESAAMGALFQAAHLSKGFKVKPFHLEDIVIFPVQVNFVSNQKRDDGEIVQNPITRQMFQYKAGFPTTRKTISFTSFEQDFGFELNHGDVSHFTKDQIEQFSSLTSKLSSISVGGVSGAIEKNEHPEETEFKGVKVGFRLDKSGIVRVEKAEAIIQRKKTGVVESITSKISGFFSSTSEEEEGDKESEEKKEEETDGKEGDREEKNEEKKNEKEEKSKDEDDKKEDSKDKKDTDEAKKNGTEEVAKKKKIPDVSRTPLTVVSTYAAANIMNSDQVTDAKKILESFERAEKLAAERAAAENELEAYAFEATLLLDEEEFVRFASEKEKESLGAETKRVRAWLEDETSPETKTGEFKENYNTIRDIVHPIKKRSSEAQSRPLSISNLESMINSSRVFVGMGGDDEKSLFNKSDTVAFEKKLNRLTTWLEGKKTDQKQKKEYEDPAVFTSEIEGKIKALDRELKSFMKKMRSERTVNLTKDKEAKRGEEKKKEKEEKKEKKEPTVDSTATPPPVEPSEENKKTEL